MAGESYLSYGLGYVFDGPETVSDELWKEPLLGVLEKHRDLISIIEPFHGASNAERFAAILKRGKLSGDVGEWSDLGIQQTPEFEPTAEEQSAFGEIIEAFSAAGIAPRSGFGLVISVTADC